MSIVVQKQLTMSSREIAALTGKRHDNVKRTIEALAESGVIVRPQIEDEPRKDTHGRLRTTQVFRFSGEQGKRDSIVVVAQLCPEFTARLVDRWQELERGASSPPQPDRALPAVDFVRLALDHLPNLGETAKQALLSEASEVAFGQRLIPLPRVVEHLRLAGEVGAMFGVTPNKIGRLANQNDMKTPEYGEYRLSKSKHSDRQVETFYYNQAAVDRFEQLLTPH
jgi:phage regulator Rha-like protein